MVRETVVLPTPPLSAPTTITTGFAMNFPYAPFLIEAQSCDKRCRLFSRNTSTGSGFCPVIVGRPACSRRRNAPIPALGANMAETRENSIHSTAVRVNPADVLNGEGLRSGFGLTSPIGRGRIAKQFGGGVAAH